MSADGKQVTKQGYGVCEIRGRVGSCVHSVVFVHRNGETQVWGDAGGDEVQPFLLGETENICKVTACISKNHRGEWIRFTTTTGRDFMLRGHERDPMKTPKEQIVEFNAPSGYVVVGLQWSTGESARDGKIVDIVIAPVVVCAIEYATGSCVDRITFVNFDGSVRRYGGAADFRPTAREELNLEKGEHISGVCWRNLWGWSRQISLRITNRDRAHRILKPTENSVWTMDGKTADTRSFLASSPNHAIVGLRWSADHWCAHASMISVEESTVPFGTYKPIIAAIGRKGLPNNSPSNPNPNPGRDRFETFSLELIKDWLGEEAINTQFSQVYYSRGQMRAAHSHAGEYSAPTIGAIGRLRADIVKVVKVGLNNSFAKFDESSLIAYHGLPASQMRSFDLAEDVPRFRLKGSSHGAHGRGVYLTQSFQMACMYAYIDFLGNPRFAVTPDGQHYIVVAMCAVEKKEAKKCKGTAFWENNDGWEHDQLELLVKKESAVHAYGLLFCFFNPDPEPKRNHFDKKKLELARLPDGKSFKLNGADWTAAEPRVSDGTNLGKLYVRREACDSKKGALLACSCCVEHCHWPDDGACLLATTFTKHKQDDGGSMKLRVLAVPRVHISGLADPQFWTLSSKSRRILLWELRDEGIRAAKDAVRQSKFPQLDRRLHVARPVWRGGEWVYDLSKVRAGGMLLVFHTFVSREHLHLHVVVAGEDGGRDLIRGAGVRWTAGSEWAELGLPGSYSVTWRQVYELCCDESMSIPNGSKWRRDSNGCQYTLAFCKRHTNPRGVHRKPQP